MPDSITCAFKVEIEPAVINKTLRILFAVHPPISIVEILGIAWVNITKARTLTVELVNLAKTKSLQTISLCPPSWTALAPNIGEQKYKSSNSKALDTKLIPNIRNITNKNIEPNAGNRIP